MTGQGDFGGPHLIQEHEMHDQPKFQVYHQEENEKHDLSDLFEIALTALAYLSFGMFIVHVIMCISSVVSFLAYHFGQNSYVRKYFSIIQQLQLQ